MTTAVFGRSSSVAWGLAWPAGRRRNSLPDELLQQETKSSLPAALWRHTYAVRREFPQVGINTTFVDRTIPKFPPGHYAAHAMSLCRDHRESASERVGYCCRRRDCAWGGHSARHRQYFRLATSADPSSTAPNYAALGNQIYWRPRHPSVASLSIAAAFRDKGTFPQLPSL